MRVFVFLYPTLATLIFVNSTSIEISSAPVALPDPESLINSISCAIFDVYKSAVVALYKNCSEVLETPSHHLEITEENEINLGTRSMLDVVRSDVNIVFGNFNAALTKLSKTMKEASNLGQAELQPAQVVWNELKYGVRCLKRNILLIRANMNKSLDEIRKNFENGSEQFSKAMNDLYTKVSNKLSFEVRSATNMFQHALSLPRLKYYDIDLEDIYQDWTQFLQLAKEKPNNLFKSAKNLINLIYNNIQAKFFLSGALSDNSLWPLSSIVWGDAVQVKRFVDNSLRHLERYIKTALDQIRSKFGKGSAALREANRSLYNQVYSEVKELIDMTEIPFKRISNFNDGQLPFPTECATNPTYNGRFEELLKYLQAKGYPVQIVIAECVNLVSSDIARPQAENFFDYLLEDTFKNNSPTSEVLSTYTNILQEERIKEVTDIYKRLFNVVQQCAETAHEEGYKLPELISMKIEDDANKYTLLMNDIRAYICKSAFLIEEYYGPSSEKYQNALNGLCEDVKHRLNIAADYTLNSIKRLNNYLENHESCLEKFPLWTNSDLTDIIVSENLGSNEVRIVDALTSVSDTDNIEKVGFRDLKLSNAEEGSDSVNSNSLKITSGTLEKEFTTSQVDVIKTEIQYNNAEDAGTAVTPLELNQGTQMNEEQVVGLSLDDIRLKGGPKDLTSNTEETATVKENMAVTKDESVQIVTSHKSDKTNSIDGTGITDLKSTSKEYQDGDLMNVCSTKTTEMSKKIEEYTAESELHEMIDSTGSNNILSKTEGIQSNNFEERSFTATDQDIRLDQELNDDLINEIVQTETIGETTNVLKEDTTISEHQFTYGSTIHVDASSEENQLDNLGTLISDKESNVLDNIVSSEEVDGGHINDQQAINNLLGLNKGSEEKNIGSTSSDIVIEKSDKSSTSIVDKRTHNFANTDTIASKEHGVTTLDISEKLNLMSEISKDLSTTIEQTEQDHKNEIHTLSKDVMSNLDMLEQQVNIISNFNSEDLFQGTNKCDSNAKINHVSEDIAKETEFPLDCNSPNEEISTIKLETLKDTSTSSKIDSAMKNEAMSDQKQISIDYDSVISSKTTNDEISSAIKIEESSIANALMDSNLMIHDNECDANSRSSSDEHFIEVANVKKCRDDVEGYEHILASGMDSISSNTELENAISMKSEMKEILESSSQKDIQQMIGLTEDSDHNSNKMLHSEISLGSLIEKEEKENKVAESRTANTPLKSTEQEMLVDSNLLNEENDSNIIACTRSLMSSEVYEEEAIHKLNEELQTTGALHETRLLSKIPSENIVEEQSQLETASQSTHCSENSKSRVIVDEKMVIPSFKSDVSECAEVNDEINLISSNIDDLSINETIGQNGRGSTKMSNSEVDTLVNESIAKSLSKDFNIAQSSYEKNYERNTKETSDIIFDDRIIERIMTPSSINELSTSSCSYQNIKEKSDTVEEIHSSTVCDNISSSTAVDTVSGEMVESSTCAPTQIGTDCENRIEESHSTIKDDESVSFSQEKHIQDSQNSKENYTGEIKEVISSTHAVENAVHKDMVIYSNSNLSDVQDSDISQSAEEGDKKRSASLSENSEKNNQEISELTYSSLDDNVIHKNEMKSSNSDSDFTQTSDFLIDNKQSCLEENMEICDSIINNEKISTPKNTRTNNLEDHGNLIEEITKRESSQNTVHKNIVTYSSDDSNNGQNLNTFENIEKSQKSSEVDCLMLNEDKRENVLTLNDDVSSTKSFDIYGSNEKEHTEINSLIVDDIVNGQILKSLSSDLSTTQSSDSLVSIKKDSEDTEISNRSIMFDDKVPCTDEVLTSNNDLNTILDSDSQKNVEYSKENTEVKENDLNTEQCSNLCEKNEKNCQGNSEVCGLVVNENTVNEKIVSTCNNNLFNEECEERSSLATENLEITHSSVLHENDRKIGEVITAGEDTFMKMNSISDEIIEKENGQNNLDELNHEISIMNGRSLHMNDQITTEDTIIDRVEEQIESNEIHRSRNELENIEGNIENAIEAGSLIENEAQKVMVDSKMSYANEEVVEMTTNIDKCTSDLDDNTLGDIQISKNEMESDIQTESTVICHENHEHEVVINDAAIIAHITDSVDKQDEKSILEDWSTVTSLDDKKNEIPSKAISSEKTIGNDMLSVDIDDKIIGSTIGSKEGYIQMNVMKENEQHTVINELKEQERILAELSEETKLKGTMVDEITSNIKDEKVIKTMETSRSSIITKSDLNISAENEDTSDGQMQLSETNDIDSSNKLTSRKKSETQSENISVENTAEQQTLLDEFSPSNDATTIVKKTVVRNEINEQKTDVSFEDFSHGSQSENIVTTNDAISAAKKTLALEKGEGNEDENEPFYHMVLFPKKSPPPTTSLPVNSSSDDDYGWLGWLLPGKRSLLETNSENFRNALGRVYDSRTKFLTSTSDKQLETSNAKNVEIEQSNSCSSSTSETTQSSFTKTNSIGDSAEIQFLDIPKSNVNVISDFSEMGITNTDCAEDKKHFELVTAANSVAPKPEEPIFFKKWFNPFVKTK